MVTLQTANVFAAFAFVAGSVLAAEGPSEVFDGGPARPRGRIDELVWARLTELKILPARDCSDSVFVRRAYLDIIGTLPTEPEVSRFLRDPAPDRRAKLIDALLEREEFADYWAMKWCDLLRVKAEFPVNLWPNGVQAYHRWIRDSIRQNLPYDRFARALLTSSGSNFRDPPVNFYRAAQGGDPVAVAQSVALTFMGVRPDRLPPRTLAGLAAFFTKVEFKGTGEWKESILVFNPARTCTNPAVAPAPVFPDGSPARIAPGQDPRVVFADWLVRAENPWFARAIANRVWAWLLGRGIVHEPDDFRQDNPPSNPALLEYLSRRLAELNWDLKGLMREILNSQTYQFSPIPAAEHPQAAAQFAYYPMRRLEAEVLMDALCMITGTTEEYQSPIPEPFTWVPRNVRTIQLADGSITSPFLEMFGRPPRDTGLESERSNRITPDQRLHLLNSTHIRRKIEQGPKLAPIYAMVNNQPAEMVRRIYLTILSREPTPAERQRIEAYARSGAARGRELAVDLVWALINSSEFLYRH
ncbi:MAG: DUF1549 and DUF1553 domain-containing protein [Kiritimatiellae bacterium]|nr:DUF1549 and DUF1553 domain-containing protein [Kiritimatiellia bacterium]